MTAQWKNWKTAIRSVLAATAASALLTGTAACGLGGDTAGAASAQGDTVNIGVLYPKTGQYAEYLSLIHI